MQDRGPVHRHMRRLVGRLLRELDYETVLEVGCGAGHNLPLLRIGAPRRIDGLDISATALERARRAGFGTLYRADVADQPPSGRWDLVFSSLLLEHVPDDLAALAAMRSVCDRHLVVTTIAGDLERYRPWEEQVGHVRNYARGELERKLVQAGFEPVKAVYWGFPFYSPIGRSLQNRMRATPSYGRAMRAVAAATYGLYRLNSRSRGDLLIAHARPV